MSLKEYLKIQDKENYIKNLNSKGLLELIDLYYFLNKDDELLMELDSAQIINNNKMFIYSISEQDKLNLTDAEKQKGFNLIDLMNTGRFLKSEFKMHPKYQNNFGYKLNFIKKILLSENYLKYIESNIMNIEKGVPNPDFVNFNNSDTRKNYEILYDIIIELWKTNKNKINKNIYDSSYFNKKVGDYCFTEDKKMTLKSIYSCFIDEFSNVFMPLFNNDLTKAQVSKQLLNKIILDFFNNKDKNNLLNNLKKLTQDKLITGIQTIYSNGEKKVNGDQKGNIIPIRLNPESNKLYLCEGVATGLSISKLTEDGNIVSCINVKNMEELTKIYINQGYEIILCIDIDKPIIKNNEIKAGAGTQLCYNIEQWLKLEENLTKLNKISLVTSLPTQIDLNNHKLKDLPFRDDALGITPLGILFRVKDFTGGKFSDFNDLEQYSKISENGFYIQNLVKNNLNNPLKFNKEMILKGELLNYIDNEIFDLKIFPFFSIDNSNYLETKRLPIINLNNENNLNDEQLNKILILMREGKTIENSDTIPFLLINELVNRKIVNKEELSNIDKGLLNKLTIEIDKLHKEYFELNNKLPEIYNKVNQLKQNERN